MKIHHLDEGSLQALLDGELPHLDEADARQHVSACAECSSRFRHLEMASLAFSGAVSLLDRPLNGTVGRVMAPPSMSSNRGRWHMGPLRRAAVMLVTVAAAASATIPGSPVRSWFASQLETDQTVAVAEPDSPDGSAETLAATAAREIAEQGVAVEPEGGRLRIVVSQPAAELRVRALLTDSPRGGAYIVGDSATARFDYSAGRVEVIGATGGDLRVEIPRSATLATLEIDGRVYVRKQGDELMMMTPPAEGRGAEIEFLVP